MGATDDFRWKNGRVPVTFSGGKVVWGGVGGNRLLGGPIWSSNSIVTVPRQDSGRERSLDRIDVADDASWSRTRWRIARSLS